MNEKNIAIVKELYRSFKEYNDDNIVRLLSKDIRWNQMDGFPGRGRCVGITEVLGHVFSGLRSEWTDWQSVANDFFACGDTVFVKGYYSGTHRVTGKAFNVPFLGEYKIEQGRISEFNQFTDTFRIVQAMVAG